MNGLKWFLFAFCDLETVLDFAFVSEFLVATSLLEPAEVCRTELKPFLAIFGTSMRAIARVPLSEAARPPDTPDCSSS